MVWSLAYSADGKLLATGGFDQTVRLWNTETGQRLAVLRGPKTPIVGLIMTRDSRWLMVASQEQIIRRYQRLDSVEAQP